MLVVIVGCLIAGQCPAADPTPAGSVGASDAETVPAKTPELLLEKKVVIDETPDSAEETLLDSASVQEGVVTVRPLERVRRTWIDGLDRLEEKFGLRLSFDYSALVQVPTDSRAEDFGSAGEIRGTVRWRPWGRDGNNPANLVLQGWHRHGYSEIAPSGLGLGIGSLWPTARGFNDRGWALNHLYFEQYLADQRFAFRTGWTRVDGMLDVHAMRAQRTFFLNSGVTDNPAVAFPSSALTALAMYRPLENLKFKAGISDAETRQLFSTGNSNRFLKDYFAAGHLGWTPRLFEQGETLFQGMYWHRSTTSEPDRPDGDGISVLAQHRSDRNDAAFLRYSYSANEATAASHVVAAGGGVSPFPESRPDLMGLSLAWGQPAVSGFRDQYVVETFYRLQVTSQFAVTPDIQFIIHPSFNPEHDLVVVFGLRARLIL